MDPDTINPDSHHCFHLVYPWVGAQGSGVGEVGEERLRGLQLDLEKMRQKLGQKNYEYANLKVSLCSVGK